MTTNMLRGVNLIHKFSSTPPNLINDVHKNKFHENENIENKQQILVHLSFRYN
jgi:hypothetical protein